MGYDPLDRLLAETTALGTVSYQYDALGRRTQMTVSGQSPITYSYDAASRLRTITQAPLNPVEIQYDALGRRTLLTLPNGVSMEYVYDLGSRLTALVYRNALGLLGDLTYQYDPAGNRVGVGGSFARTLLAGTIPSAMYDAANRQLAFGTRAMTFDDNGSLTTITGPAGTTSFTWDARNRLTAINGPSISASFAYDAVERRIAKTVNEVASTFHYDGLDIVRESGPAGEASYVRTLTIDQTLVRTDAAGPVVYLQDALGSTLALTTPTGSLSTEYTYAAFGETTATGLPSPNPFQFTGREQDMAGFYYYRMRYYMPTLGRFLSEDGARTWDQVQFYSYAENSPVNRIDPLGLKPLCVCGGFSGCAAIGIGGCLGTGICRCKDECGRVEWKRFNYVCSCLGLGGSASGGGAAGGPAPERGVQEGPIVSIPLYGPVSGGYSVPTPGTWNVGVGPGAFGGYCSCAIDPID